MLLHTHLSQSYLYVRVTQKAYCSSYLILCHIGTFEQNYCHSIIHLPQKAAKLYDKFETIIRIEKNWIDSHFIKILGFNFLKIWLNYVKYGSSIITSKIPSKILINENKKKWCFQKNSLFRHFNLLTFCLEVNRNTSVYVFIIEIFLLTFDVIIDDPYLTL